MKHGVQVAYFRDKSYLFAIKRLVPTQSGGDTREKVFFSRSYEASPVLRRIQARKAKERRNPL